jgi:hypothetical protein
VLFELVIHQFRDGQTPEEIVVNFPSPDLGDVYLVCGYYLHHQEALGRYLDRVSAEAERVAEELGGEARWAEIRERLAARQRSGAAAGN